MAPFTPLPPRSPATTSHLCQDLLDTVFLNFDVSDAEKTALEQLLIPDQPHFHLQHIDDGDAARALHASVTAPHTSLVDQLLEGPVGAAIQPEKIPLVRQLLEKISEVAYS